ncbi:DUF4159 domain-containing protein [Nereida sp. MMG025]|uniref:DUF4159 domain-containing protein n=1 Tax=Nereida sp. MMG025 TaxID=2909981 RepID=UPI001F3A65D9|nr:DUF4159 domain-containing protein [Nereida sp. MMG025]MCF6445451.1 DUF4159 domain-containing protein [Nereida sp. MMG025]
MMTLFGIGFAAPWLLLGLVALPILWLLLRAVPPAPVKRMFPGVALLLGLNDDEQQTDTTPWWLLLLRTLAVAALITGFAGPVLNPNQDTGGDGPLLIVADGSWASARDWTRREDRIQTLLTEAAREGREVALVSLTDPDVEPQFLSADVWLTRLAGLSPQPWAPVADQGWIEDLPDRYETYWLSDGIARMDRAEVLARFQSAGTLTVFENPSPVLALAPARFEDGAIVVRAVRNRTDVAQGISVNAVGLDPAGIERVLAAVDLEFDGDASEAETALSLPAELRNRITRFEIAGQRSAGAVSLTDDTLKRREIALIAGGTDREGLELLSPLHYLERALIPTADMIDGTLEDILLANPDVIVLADVATLSGLEAEQMETWVEDGGLLLRFAGPRVAASDVSRGVEDPLMPVRLRAGGRSVGGAMSWGEPKGLAPFAADTPFAGLPVPSDVTVSSQVMAEPDPTLSDRVIAELADGTPLVTRKQVGAGQVVLFHVTANAEWSTLPLSGLFVQMLERLAVSTQSARPEAEDLAGTIWAPDVVLSAFGVPEDAGTRAGVAGEIIAQGQVGPELPAGLYAGEDRRLAVNVVDDDTVLERTAWPEGVAVEGLGVTAEQPLKGLLLSAAMGMLMIDILASIWLSGRLFGPRATAGLAIVGLALALTGEVQAQSEADMRAIDATSEAVLAHVVTGDSTVDELAYAGLRGLSDTLFQRTSIEPSEPISVNLETDELAFYPFLYWPVTPNQPTPSAEAYAKLNRYLRTGGMILFDTRDADTARFGASSPNGRKLQSLASPLDIPAIEPIPSDHVLTRAFYLLQDFPGRHASRDVWVEAAPPDAEQIEGMPFRNLNDGVTPVVIGGNDWAAAWAVDRFGAPMVPIGRGFAGERQREIAKRFGVNLIMHVLTGNYKSDQVHVPALLDRLGQ